MLPVETALFHRAMGKHSEESHVGGYKVSWQNLEAKTKEGLRLPASCRSPASGTTGPLWSLPSPGEGQNPEPPGP